MKRLKSMSLAGCLALSSIRCVPSPAAESPPIPRPPVPIFLGIALKCVAAATIGGTAIIIYRCEPSWYLVRVEEEDELPFWYASQASARTLRSNPGRHRRCEGPWPTSEEPGLRAWANNKTPWAPMFPCGPLGSIPGPTYTNTTLLTLQASSGGSWANVASLTIEAGEANWSVAVLPPTGTNGMSREQLLTVAGCDAVVTNTMPITLHTNITLFRAAYQQP